MGRRGPADGTTCAGDVLDVFGYLPLMHWRGMLTGRGRIRSLVDDRYPGIEPTTVEQHVAAEGL